MKKLRVFIKVLAVMLIFVMLISVSGCGNKEQPTQTNSNDKRLSGTIKLGIAYATSGKLAKVSKASGEALLMAINDVNRSGILGDAKMEAVIEDAADSAESAINAYQKLIQQHKVKFITGPDTVIQCQAAYPVAQSAGVLTLSLVTDKNTLTIGDNIFQMFPTNEDSIPAVMDQIVKAKNIKTAAMFTQKDYSSSMVSATVRRSELSKLGVKVLVDEQGMGAETDFTAIITKIIQANPDMVIVDGAIPFEPLFLTQLKKAGYKGSFMTGRPGQTNMVVGANSVAYEGQINFVEYLADMQGSSQKSLDFSKRFKEITGQPPDASNAGRYDTVWALAYAIKKAGTVTDVKAVWDAMDTLELEGVRGTVKFNGKRYLEFPPILVTAKNGMLVPFSQ